MTVNDCASLFVWAALHQVEVRVGGEQNRQKHHVAVGLDPGIGVIKVLGFHISSLVTPTLGPFFFPLLLFQFVFEPSFRLRWPCSYSYPKTQCCWLPSVSLSLSHLRATLYIMLLLGCMICASCFIQASNLPYTNRPFTTGAGRTTYSLSTMVGSGYAHVHNYLVAGIRSCCVHSSLRVLITLVLIVRSTKHLAYC